MARPDISIVTPAWRTAHFIPDMMESVATQASGSFTWEHVIVLDGDIDNSAEVVQATGRELGTLGHVRLYKGKHRGCSYAVAANID